MFTTAWFKATAVASAVAARPVTLIAIPVPKARPMSAVDITIPPPTGSISVLTATLVPTVGAVARLNSFTKATAAPVLLACRLYTVPALALTLVAAQLVD